MTPAEIQRAIEWLQQMADKTPRSDSLHWHYEESVKFLLNELRLKVQKEDA